jgi:hypothetical protein
MVLSVFGDESSDETKQRVFAVSGLIGTEAEWQQAETEWTAKTGGEVFHAADWEYAGRKDDYKVLAQTLADSPVAGVVYAIDLVAFNEVFPDTLREASYLQCFTRIIVDIADNAMAFNTRVPHCLSKVEYTFDNRPEVEFSAARLYGTLINEPGWRPASLLASKISFECRTNPRIQMADMIAREGMKDLDRLVGPVNFPERKSKIELAKDDHFRFFVLVVKISSASAPRSLTLTRTVSLKRLTMNGYVKLGRRTLGTIKCVSSNTSTHGNCPSSFVVGAFVLMVDDVSAQQVRDEAQR